MNRPCYRHSDRDGTFFCQKDMKYMCEACACCHSPRIYCQYRTACMINLLTREGELEGCDKKGMKDEGGRMKAEEKTFVRR